MCNIDTVGALLERALHGTAAWWGSDSDSESNIDNTAGRLVHWRCVGHWGHCGESCQCCRFANGEVNGSCLACFAAAQSLPIVSTIASFCCFAGETREVRAALSGRLGPRGSLIPPTVVKLIGDLLPKTSLVGTMLVATEIHPWRLLGMVFPQGRTI